MRRKGYNMAGQLTIPFEITPPARQKQPPEQSAVEKAEKIIQKYLRIQKRCSDLYYNAKYGTRLYTIGSKAYDNAQRACTRMINALQLETASFDDMERKRSNELGIAGNYQGKGTEHIRKEHEDNARVYRRILDGFGYIQEEYDMSIRRSEAFLEPGEQYDEEADGWENGKPIGYHYWLFEDAIARIPVPIIIIDKYIEKYGTQEQP